MSLQDDGIETPEQLSRILWRMAPMSRRDHFAAAALTGLYANPDINAEEFNDKQYMADWAAMIADAMIAELDKEPGE